ncbi:MAG: acyltransferase, partial [Bdellovibrionales bacterium]|nr:acyltransferase [Bdellovibrionales bacterium]
NAAKLEWYWSLAVEEQFYFLYPFYFLIVHKYLFKKQGIFLTCAIIFIPAVILRVFNSEGVPEVPNIRLSFHYIFDSLLFGVLAYQVRGKTWIKNTLNFVKKYFFLNFLLSVVLILILANALRIFSSVGLGYFVMNLSSFLLVLLASTNNRSLIFHSSIFGRILKWIGVRSYAIYLIHMPVFWFTKEILYRVSPLGISEMHPSYLLLMATLFIVIFSELNYRYVEKPGIKFAEFLNGNTKEIAIKNAKNNC